MTHPDRPAFGLALRGYARAEVDAHAARAAAELAQVREDLARAVQERDQARQLLAEQQEQAQQLQELQARVAEEHRVLVQEHRARVQMMEQQRDEALEQVRLLERTVPFPPVDAPTLDPYPDDPHAPTQAVRARAGAAVGSGVGARVGATSTTAPGTSTTAPGPWPERPRRPGTESPRPVPGAADPSGSEQQRSRWLLLLPLALLLAAAAAVVAWQLGSGGDAPARDTAAGGSTAADAARDEAAPGTAAQQPTAEPAPPAPAADAPLPEGWTTQRADDGSWTVGLPAGWTAVGQGDGQQFVSASGLTTLWVRTAPVAQPPTPAQLERYEADFAAGHPGYERLGAAPTEHLGNPALTWDYQHGAGPEQRRGSDLAVLVGDRGYWLHVETRASAWRFAAPLVEQVRASFVPS
jgi:hypothetical protein